MVYKRRDTYELSSGRTFYANRGILGLTAWNDDPDEEFSRSVLFEGYDGPVSESLDEPFTQSERAEIAEFMIARWMQWAGDAERTIGPVPTASPEDRFLQTGYVRVTLNNGVSFTVRDDLAAPFALGKKVTAHFDDGRGESEKIGEIIRIERAL